MGPENKNEFTGGTLYIGDCAIEVKSLEMTDFESMVDATDNFHSVAKIVKEPMEFTCTCEVKFRDLVKLLGFWPAVKYIERDLREILDNMYEFEENNDYKED